MMEREVGPDRLVRPLRLRLVLLRTVFPHFGLSVWRDGQGRGGPRPCFLLTYYGMWHSHIHYLKAKVPRCGMALRPGTTRCCGGNLMVCGIATSIT